MANEPKQHISVQRREKGDGMEEGFINRWVVLVLLILTATLIGACGSREVEATPTAVVLPSSTPRPTATPLPTSTVIPTPTPTPQTNLWRVMEVHKCRPDCVMVTTVNVTRPSPFTWVVFENTETGERRQAHCMNPKAELPEEGWVYTDTGVLLLLPDDTELVYQRFDFLTEEEAEQLQS